MGSEYELKYAATPEILAAIHRDLGDFAPIKMETTYFDTPEGSLSARRITLRLRKENDKSICCVKTPGRGDLCGEWEVEAASMEAGLPILCKLCDGADLILLTQTGVAPICGASFTRLCKHITCENCTVELALDEGILLGGGKTAPLSVVEVELKSGESACAAAFAQNLAERYSLRPERRSKFRRAYALAKGE